MNTTWDPSAAGVLRLPSGRLVRGRGLRNELPDGPKPDFALHLRGRRPPETEWESRWLRWPDFWLPTDRAGFGAALREALERSETERVEIACGGGFGRTGTALACLVAMDGSSEHDPISYVRENYSKRAVETPWQKRFVGRFS